MISGAMVAPGCHVLLLGGMAGSLAAAERDDNSNPLVMIWIRKMQRLSEFKATSCRSRLLRADLAPSCRNLGS